MVKNEMEAKYLLIRKRAYNGLERPAQRIRG